MARCRFYHGSHTYSQDECDRSFCYKVLGHQFRPRERALPLHPNPRLCDHEWEEVLGRVSVLGAETMVNSAYMMLGGKVVMSERRFKVCLLCGEIRYLHPELGEITCDPIRS